MDGFTPIRNGLLDHLRDGRLSLLEFAVYVLLHMRANFETGIYTGCALTLAYQAGDFSRERQIQDALRRLKNKRYINYPRGHGERGGYPILIHKYEPSVGRWSGTRLNAWKHGVACRPEYDRLTPQSGDARGRVAPQSPDARPNKDLRPNTQDNPETDLSKRTTEELLIMKRTFTRGGAKCPDSIAEELQRRGIDTGDLRLHTIHAVSVGSFGPGKIGRLTVLGLQAAYHLYARRILRAKLHPGVARVFRLAWASTNLGRGILSFSDLNPREARLLTRIMAAEKPDLAWPKRHSSRQRRGQK